MSNLYFEDFKDFTAEFISEEYSPEHILKFFKKITTEYTEARL